MYIDFIPYVCLCTTCVQCLQSPEESVYSPENAVADVNHNVGAQN